MILPRSRRSPRAPEALGIDTLACPVTGGVHRAEAGDITVLVGGAQQVFALHEPALRPWAGA